MSALGESFAIFGKDLSNSKLLVNVHLNIKYACTIAKMNFDRCNSKTSQMTDTKINIHVTLITNPFPIGCVNYLRTKQDVRCL